MSRNFAAVTPPTRPDGYDKRMTREMPREAADNSGYEERIYQCSDKLASRFTGEPADENLLERVKDIRTVAQTAGHKVSDYKGESPWFVKAVLTDTADQNRCITLTLAANKNFKAVANPEGEYYNSLEYCNDNLTWNTLSLNTDIVPYIQHATVVHITEQGNPLVFARLSDDDRMKEDVQMYAFRNDDSQPPYNIYYFNTPDPTTSSSAWTYNPADGTWEDESQGVIVVSTDTTRNIWLRGRILRKGGVCPKLSGVADAITKVEGDLSSLLDFRATTAVVPSTRSLSWLFSGCTALTDASGLVFPNGKPSGDRAYRSMFEDCSALTAVPSLYNVIPAVESFWSMFEDCSSLVTAPILPRVETLASRAYVSMFRGCSALTSITAYIGKSVGPDALLTWMSGAGTATGVTHTFNHAEDTYRWYYPSLNGIPQGWTPVPALTTRLYFSSETGVGIVTAVAGSASINSGDPVNVGTSMTVTATAPVGYTFDSWVKKPAGAQGASNILTFSMPYSRYDETDKVECVARFTHNSNLAVVYQLEGTTTHLAFVRYPEGDTTKEGAPAYAWTPGDVNNATIMTGIGLLYTDTLEPIIGSKLYKQDASGSWFDSTASLEDGVWTNNFTVIVFDNATTYSNSIKISVAGGSTYYNTYKSFCALTAAANTSITIDVYQSGGTTHVATEDLHWSDGNTDNPRSLSVASPGICLSRDAN